MERVEAVGAVEATEAVEAVGTFEVVERLCRNETTIDNAFPCGSSGTQFDDLPFDICCEIVRHLDIESALSLLSTNRHLHDSLSSKFLFLISRLEKEIFLQLADAFSKYRRLQMLACFDCLRMLPRSSFASSVSPEGTWSRLCFNCVSQRRSSVELSTIRYDGTWYYLCHTCSHLGTRFNRCHVKRDWSTALPFTREEIIISCVGHRKRSPLENLTDNILRRITQQLDYLDLIKLRNSCCLMRLNVSVDWVPLHERFLVMRKYEPIVSQAESSQLRPHGGTATPLRYPCYGCFQVKKLKAFNSTQLELSTVKKPHKFWKRRCKHCLRRLYIKDDVRPLEEWRRRLPCSECGCLRYKGQRCHACFSPLYLYRNARPDSNTTPADRYGQVLDQMKTWSAGYAGALQSVEAEKSATGFSKENETLLEKRRRVLWEAVYDDNIRRMSLQMV